jgi:hypothetical protein
MRPVRLLRIGWNSGPCSSSPCQPPRGSRGCVPHPSHGAFCLAAADAGLGAYGLQDAPAFRSAEHDVLKQHHEEPEREASRCFVRAAVVACVRGDLMSDRLLPGRQVPVIFRIARDCEADHTAAAVRKRHAADRCMLVCLYASVRPHGG